jgi:acetyl esterase/lipase
MRGQEPFTGAPESLRALMARIGPAWASDIRRHSELVKQAYRPLLEAANGGAEVLRQHAYGPHPRQVVDVFLPAGRAGGSVPVPAVVAFVHGGAFVRGERSSEHGIYDNVLHWFARQGCLGINVEYRHAPEAPWPAGAEDVAAAVEWVRAHVAEFGYEGAPVFLVGHSAGGTHVAGYAWDPACARLGRHLAGIVLVSARLRADAGAANPNAAGVRAYFGDDDALYEQRSPVTHCESSALPVFLAVAEFENPLLDVYGLEAAWRIARARGRAPRFVTMAGHNHMSIMAHFNTAEDALGREILAFMRSVSG